jgi:hypothetical protein
VQDWGGGFELQAALQETSLGEHVGLREMQERVQLIGGDLTMCSQPGVGTLIVVEVPLLPADERSIFPGHDGLPQRKSAPARPVIVETMRYQRSQELE